MPEKTVMQYVEELKAIVGGRLIFGCPNHFVILGDDGREYALAGPGVTGWHGFNQAALEYVRKHHTPIGALQPKNAVSAAVD